MEVGSTQAHTSSLEPWERAQPPVSLPWLAGHLALRRLVVLDWSALPCHGVEIDSRVLTSVMSQHYIKINGGNFMLCFLVNYHIVLCGLESIIMQICHCEDSILLKF